MRPNGWPRRQGLYDPTYEKDACGIGFVANIKGIKSNDILRKGLEGLLNHSHRGALGAEENTGDGAGILIQIPHAFLHKACVEEGIQLPPYGQYGVGMVFLPRDAKLRYEFEAIFEKIVGEEGQSILGWRTVPTNNSLIGKTARMGEPCVRQVFIARSPELKNELAFERSLYVIRKRAENAIRHSGKETGLGFYVCSLSHRTLVYKGMLTAHQLEAYYPDLSDPAMETGFALFHARFSTNTFPSWDRAHPYRYLVHNGEINTLRGNVNWMHARQSMFACEHFGGDIRRIFPIIDPEGSDSAMFDNSLEFLILAGYSLPHAVMMMIPEPWSRHEGMNPEKKAFYEYYSCLMEPWDGPAHIVFTDGVRIGAVLDRNGLRPSRYTITKDDFIILASETGVIDVPVDSVQYKARLQPGRMLLVDTAEGRIIGDRELKQKIASERPYRRWLDEHLITIEDLPPAPPSDFSGSLDLIERQRTFGYTYEELQVILGPMAKTGAESVGSMGNDMPPAVLSDRPQLLYNYFKQLFAQVTNPPIDAIREKIITATEVTIGAESNLLQPTPESCRRIKLNTPILTNEELAKLRVIDLPGLTSVTLSTLFTIADKGTGLEKAMDRLYRQADLVIKKGASILILSDRGTDKDNAPIPALLAVSGLHHHLIRKGTRTKIGIVLESGEPREEHHFSTLIGYGASGINPYLVYETLDHMIQTGFLPDIEYDQAVANYNKAVVKGVVKVMSKMGISTIQSYCGAQIFEALGLDRGVVDKYFTWTPSRMDGIGLDDIAHEAAMRHERAFATHGADSRTLDPGGYYKWRRDGEHHLFNPESIHKLQLAARTGNYEIYKEYARLINDQSQRLATLRGLLEIKSTDTPLPIEEVEPVEEIFKRFKTGAMSYGALSLEAHECLAVAMNRIGGKSNTGEGGEDPMRYTPLPNGDSSCSAIKQVASARFGVTSQYLVNSQEIQIKMAQGSKPGEGGQLPGGKVYPWIAKVRHSTPGVELISPPPHHDIYSIEDLAELIHDLKNANPHARINVKLVSEVGVGVIAAGVAKGHADVILISGYDGGTGASPESSIRNAGIPWELGLSETHQTLVLNNLRDRVILETDGQLKTGRDVAIAALLGAEEFGFSTAPLIVTGCIMMRVCQKNTCPVGVATQNPELRKKFGGDPAHVVNFMEFVARELREIMAALGFRTVNEMIGRVDKLEMRKTIKQQKAKKLDFSRILFTPNTSQEVGRYSQITQVHGLDRSLDNNTLLALCEPAIERGQPVEAVLSIKNANRVVGTIVGSEITRRYGAKGVPEDTIRLHFKGSAGQSFGAFTPPGMTLILEGDANDYIGKGLSGSKMIVFPPAGLSFTPHENVIIGNVAFYGGTGGEAYINGMAGERFCVRNSGVLAVVEAVGDHGCEYMTGGRVVVLGPAGRNFAAGMSGGIAYVLDEAGDLNTRCNLEMVDLEPLIDQEEVEDVKGMIERHAEYTGSVNARRILAQWNQVIPKFVKVMPKDFKRVLQAMKRIEASGLTGEQAVMAAFEERDL
jgi:glutamate synthase (NADPH/NADH) large chain